MKQIILELRIKVFKYIISFYLFPIQFVFMIPNFSLKQITYLCDLFTGHMHESLYITIFYKYMHDVYTFMFFCMDIKVCVRLYKSIYQQLFHRSLHFFFLKHFFQYIFVSIYDPEKQNYNSPHINWFSFRLRNDVPCKLLGKAHTVSSDIRTEEFVAQYKIHLRLQSQMRESV